ncbi:MAG: MarC family protein [Geminicoccaceae bacterium]|nr:MarC family protein [Geminicoccaceae bacterium]
MLEPFWTALVALFVTVDPLGLVPIFVALAPRIGPAKRLALARRAVMLAAVVLALFAIAGEALLGWLGISIAAFRIAGGLFLFLLALEMVFERRTRRREDSAEGVVEERPGSDIAVFPLGIPLIAGPAAITTTILLADRLGESASGRLALLLALAAVLAATWLALAAASRLDRLLGPTLIGVLSRLLGLLLGALAAQYVLDGLRASLFS